MAVLTISESIRQMRAWFNSGATRPYAFRKQQLKALADAIRKYEHEIHEALHTDLKKSPEESWVTETGYVHGEIRYTLKHLKHWMQPQSVSTNLVNFPSTSYVIAEPLGVVLGILLMIYYRGETHRSFWVGFGLTLIIQSVLLFGMESMSAQRSKQYTRKLSGYLAAWPQRQ